MAIQQLTQPIINPISAFDSKKAHIISFIVIGGAQVIGNRLVIRDNQTGKEIYNKIQSTMKLEHLIPANTLINGGYYNAVVYTIDSANNESVASTAVPFYCYSQPNLTIDNIPATETIENGTYRFIGSYLQKENELLNSYQYTLYDSNKNILSQSSLIYYDTDSSLSYTFVGMSNDTAYYIELSGETVNGTKITSGLKYFTVRYLQPASFAICDLVNNCENGYIQISSNIVAIDGKSNPDPPIYIDDKEVDLRDPDSWVEWNSGFRIQDDFTMRVWGRDFTPYENIITLSNDLSSSNNPNKIEMKWMIGDTIKKLPTYKDVSGYNVNLKDSQRAPIKNLSIKGETRQKTDSGRVINEGEGYVTLNPAEGYNLFDKNIANIGKAINASGNLANNSRIATSDFIEVETDTNYFCSNVVGSNLARSTASYDENKELIEIKSLQKVDKGDFQLLTPSKAKYIRVSCLVEDIDALQVAKGTQKKPYTPFGYIPSNDFPCNISIIPGGNSIQETREESKSTVTGTKVIVNDTYESNETEFTIDGNCYQETTDGRQLFDNTLKGYGHYGAIAKTIPTGVRLSANADIAASNYIFGLYATINLSNFVGKTVRMKAMLKSNSNLKGTYSIGLCDSNGTNRAPKDNTSVSEKEISFVIPNLETGREYLGVWFYTNAGGTGVAGDYVDYTNVIITIDNEDMTYEPYTGGILSPNSDYTQKITSVGGYDNIFDKNNIISGSYVSDGHGAFVSDSTSKRTDYIEIQANSYYYIYSDKTSGNWGAWYDKDKNFISGITLGGKNENVVNSPANAKYMVFTVSYQGNLTDYSNIKINETAIKIKQSGKNLFDNNKISRMISLSYSNGIYSASDNDTATRLIYKIQQYDSNGKFILSAGEVRQNIDKSGIYYFTAQKYTTAKYLRIANSGETHEFSLYYPLDDINVGDYYTVVLNIIDTTIGASKFKDAMLLKGKITSASYEPYHEPIITPINLQGNILSKAGNVKDILKVNRNGEVEIKKNIGKLVLNGTENWGKDVDKNGETDYFYIFKSGIDYSNIASVISNRFVKGNENTEGFWATGVFCITIDKTRTGIISSDNKVTRIQKFKTWLSQHPTEVYYQLATPQTISLPKVSPIELWQGTNIFSLVTNLDTEIELEYNYIPQSPSPEAPSEIKNIGNNINILNKNNILSKNGVKTEILETGIRIIDISQAEFEFIGIPLGGKELLGKNITCYSDVFENKNIYSNAELFFGNASAPTSGGAIRKQNVSSSITWNIPSSFPNGSDQIRIYLYISGGNPPSSGYSVDYTNLKVEIGDIPTDYSPYGLGNISTVISNNNVFNLKRLIEMSSKYSKIENGYKFLSTVKMFSDGISCLYPISLPISMSYKIQNLTGTGFRFKFWFDNGETESLNAYSSGTSSEETNIVINNYTKSRYETNCKNRS